MIQTLKHKIPQEWVDFLKKRLTTKPFIQDISCNPALSDQKRALLSYITEPFEHSGQAGYSHSNAQECAKIVQSLAELGFCIDVVHYLDEKHLNVISAKTYDLALGFGVPFRHCRAAKKILYLTENHPEISRKREAMRLEYYRERTGKNVKMRRSGKIFMPEHLKEVDAILALWGEFNLKMAPALDRPLYTIEPAGLLDSHYSYCERSLSVTKKHFLWLGSSGVIHKGLDVLIEAFAELPDCTLLVAGLNPRERHLLSLRSNVRDLGFVKVGTPAFRVLMNSCSFIIMPSCSEGVSTSVLTGMNHGLIPVVTREAGVNLGEFGHYLESFRVEEVAKSLKACADWDDSTLAAQHRAIIDYARERYSAEAFAKRFKATMQEILSL